MSGQWEALQRHYGGRKLVALTESGTPPDPAKMRRYEVRWSWFSIWSGNFIRKADKALLRAMYLGKDVVTRDELPDLSQFGRPSM
jgi:mannan endo-1,4-beta-mannosidase